MQELVLYLYSLYDMLTIFALSFWIVLSSILLYNVYVIE